MVKTIALRLYNKDCRLRNEHRLPEEVKDGLRRIARKENASVSWVLEKVIIDYFDMRRPKYVARKKKNNKGKHK